MTKQIKVVLLGDTNVGKSSILQRFVMDRFDPSNKTTRVANCLSKSLFVSELNTDITFQIWDTAGQERYKCLASMYYKGADVALLIFDLTNEKTFTNIDSWVKELRDKVSEGRESFKCYKSYISFRVILNNNVTTSR